YWADTGMFRKEFISVVTNTGMMTLKEVRPFTASKDPEVISEFELLRINEFDDLRLAKVAAEKYEVQFIDLQKARISDEVGSVMKKALMTKFRVVPVQKTPKSITLATYDPTVKNLLQDIRTAVRQPVDLILTTLSA